MRRIDEMFAFVAEEKEGEGVIAVHSPMGWLPLVGANMARVESLRPYAKEVAMRSGQKVRLLRFSAREELGVLEP